MTHSTYTDILTLAGRSLAQTSHLLKILEAHIASGKISESEILEARLAPDMYPFMKQIQLVSDNAKWIAGRISGLPIPSMSDNEITLAELIDRIDRTAEFVSQATPTDTETIDSLDVTFHWLPGKALDGHNCILLMNIPNLYFHLCMAYAILRSNGVQIGKADYIGDLPFYDVASK